MMISGHIFAILLGFLTCNLLIGLYYGRGVKTLRSYALGNRNFNTATLVATIVATWIGGDYLFITIEEVYKTGLYYAVACLGMSVQFLLIAHFFVPRMGEFLGNISIAEAMGNLYGEKVRVISSICGSIGSLGILAVQFKSFGRIFKYFLEIPLEWSIVISAIFVIIYSAFGGIRAVTFTDVIQFFVFGVLIPLLGIVIYLDMHNLPAFKLDGITEGSIFDWHEFIGFGNINFWRLLSLFLLFVFPGFEPAVFQRIAIGKSISQVKTAFYLAAVILLFILIGMSWIGFLVFHINPNIEANDLIYYIMDNYGDGGLKIFILIGVVAMCMSTADSQLNATSILISHDLLKPLKIILKNELLASKIVAVVLGIIAIVMATKDIGMLELVLLTQNFYIPIVGAPFLFAIFGFRTTSKPVLIGMSIGFISVVIWELFITPITGINSFWFSFLANVICLITSHYLMKQPGGWVGIKEQSIIDSQNLAKYYQLKKLFSKIKQFNLMTFCKNNIPKRSFIYSAFGAFGLISGICTMHAIANDMGGGGKELIVFYEVMLIIPVCFLIYPIWPQFFKDGRFIEIFWNLSVFYSLVFCNAFFLLLTNFSQYQFIIFTVNAIAIGILMRWQAAMIMVAMGMISALIFYKSYTGNDIIETNADVTLLLSYSFILITTLILSLIMPVQAYQNKTEETVAHLDERISVQQIELQNLTEVKNEFLRNVKHETNTPITGILSLGQTLYHNYDKLNDDELKSGLKIIAESADKFDRVVKNICDLSKLTTLSYYLNYKKFNLSELVFTRLNICKKLYLKNQELEFFTEIEQDIIINGDEYYITSVIDNLVINAITYNQLGKIFIKLYKFDKNEVQFHIIDEGKGIPSHELLEIFGAFVVGQQTKTPAGGRGMGLAICKKVIEAHGGKIWAENNKEKGATFSFVLPVNKVAKNNEQIINKTKTNASIVDKQISRGDASNRVVRSKTIKSKLNDDTIIRAHKIKNVEQV